jgi:hypothetical protein
MAEDHKDRLGNVLHHAEAARENQWARHHDEELLEKMRERLHLHVCPKCKQVLVAKIEKGVQVHACPEGHGAWLDESVLKSVLKEHKAS